MATTDLPTRQRRRRNETPSAPPATPDQQLWTRPQAATFLQLPVRALEEDAVTAKIGVPFLKLGPKLVRYVPSVLMRWAEAKSKPPPGGTAGRAP